jgi:hypothetical protein
MRKYFTQIIGIFFVVIFLINGMASLTLLLSLPSSSHEIVKLLTKTESENPGKEKEEKIPEEELIHHKIDLYFPGWDAAANKKYSSMYTVRWRNIFLPKFTPPPEQA